MKASPETLMFVQAWRVMFYITGVFFLVVAFAIAMPWLGIWWHIDWLGHFTGNYSGLSLYGGRINLDRAESNSYMWLFFAGFPVISLLGFHFHDFARDFPIKVYPDLFKD